MTFLIISHVVHKQAQGHFYAYGPYVREMNLWIKSFDKVLIVAPLNNNIEPSMIDSEYKHSKIAVLRFPEFDILSIRSFLRTIVLLPMIFTQVVRGIILADHIHIRCPGNAGLIGCLVQLLFPIKPKTAKYASNWDWNSRQPWSYRLQQRILRNTFITKNMTTLVYGEWPNMTKNIKPFFTSSYSEKERTPVLKRSLTEGVRLAFIGTLTENKSPLISLEVLRELRGNGIEATLTFCGEGPQRSILEQRILGYGLHSQIRLLGNVKPDTVKKVLIDSHFLIFISRSEGWPKAVSEAMWWGCLPITTAVSCVPWMLDNGARGELVNGEITAITSLIEGYIADQNSFNSKSGKAMDWSRKYTTERFEEEITEFLTK